MKRTLFSAVVLSMAIGTSFAADTDGKVSTKAAEVTADSYFGIDVNENQVDGNFDQWQDLEDSDGNVTGFRPKWWETNAAYGSNGDNVIFGKAVDRYGEADKALKMTAPQTAAWYTWHVHMRTCATTTQPDCWSFVIPEGDEFYITFWAKGEVGGEVLWYGPSQMYDPNNGGVWADMPNVTLTTDWTQYGCLFRAQLEVSMLHFQPRLAGDYYLDDVVVNWGYNLPELEEGTDGVITTDASKTYAVKGGTNAISINTTTAANALVFDAAGTLHTSQQLAAGTSQVEVNGTGLYIVVIEIDGEQHAQKVVVK